MFHHTLNRKEVQDGVVMNLRYDIRHAEYHYWWLLMCTQHTNQRASLLNKGAHESEVSILSKKSHCHLETALLPQWVAGPVWDVTAGPVLDVTAGWVCDIAAYREHCWANGAIPRSLVW